MPNAFHAALTGLDNHALTAATYADLAARDADTPFQVAANIDKLVRVEDINAYFVLFSVGPALWIEYTSTQNDTFIEHADTPATFAGQAGLSVQVNAGATALEFGQALRATDSPTFAALTIGTSLALADAAGVLTLQGVDILDETTLTTISGAISDLPTLVTIQGSVIVLSAKLTVESISLINQDLTTDAAATLAGLALVSTTDALTLNVMTSTQRGAQANAAGKLVFDTTFSRPFFNTGAGWIILEEGDVSGPPSSSNDNLARWDGVNGELLQNSGVTLTDADAMSGLSQLNVVTLIVSGDTTTTNLQASENIGVGPSSPIRDIDITKAVAGIVRLGITNESTDGNAEAGIAITQNLNTFRIHVKGNADELHLHSDTTGDSIMINDGSGATSINSPNLAVASAVFEIVDTTRGFLPPRMTTTQRDAIASPATGLQIYNTTTDDQEFFNGVAWQSMGGGDVSGPASSTDDAIATFNGIGGKNIQNTTVTLLNDKLSTVNTKLTFDAGVGGITDKIAFLTPSLEFGVGQVIATVGFNLPTVVGDRVKIGRINMRSIRGMALSMQVSTSSPIRAARKYEAIFGDSLPVGGLQEMKPSQESALSDLSANNYSLEVDVLGSNMHLYARRTAGTAAVVGNLSAQFVGAGILNDTAIWVDDGGAVTTVTAPSVVHPPSMIRQIHNFNAGSLDTDHVIIGNGSTLLDVSGALTVSGLITGDGAGLTGLLTDPGNAVGDVVGPGASTNTALALFNGTNGRLIQNSLVTLSGAGSLDGINSLTMVQTLSLENIAAASFSSNITFKKERAGAIVQAEDQIARIEFKGFDGSTHHAAASIFVLVDGTPGTNDMPGRMEFSTTPDGSSGPITRMVIDNSGAIDIAGPLDVDGGNRVMPPNTVIVSVAADLPSTLIADTVYMLDAPIVITAGNELTIPVAAGVVISSTDRHANTLTYSGTTGTLFTGTLITGHFQIENVNVSGNFNTTRLFNITGAGFASMFTDKADFSNFNDLGTLTDFGGGISIGKCGGFSNSAGWKINNAVFFGLENCFFQNFSDTGYDLLTIDADTSRVSLSLVGAAMQPNERVLNINSSFTGEVIINQLFAAATGRIFNSAGLDETSIFVNVRGASNNKDSATIGSYLVDDNTTATTFVSSGTWTDLNLNALAVAGSNLEAFTLTDTTTGELTYIGLAPFSGIISFSAYVTSTGGAQDFEMRAIKNGSALTDTFEPTLNIGSDKKMFTVTVPVDLVTNDTIRPQVLRVSGTSSITISHISMITK